MTGWIMLTVRALPLQAAEAATYCSNSMQCLSLVCYPTKKLLLIGIHQIMMSAPSDETWALCHQQLLMILGFLVIHRLWDWVYYLPIRFLATSTPFCIVALLYTLLCTVRCTTKNSLFLYSYSTKESNNPLRICTTSHYICTILKAKPTCCSSWISFI